VDGLLSDHPVFLIIVSRPLAANLTTFSDIPGLLWYTLVVRSENTSSAEEILARVNREALLTVASSWAGGLDCLLDTSPPILAVGYVILVVVFPSSGNRWIARIPLDQDDSFVEFCVKPLEYVARNHSNIRATRVHGYVDGGKSTESPVGVAFLMLDWIPSMQ
jgi:hypothetical protein